MKKLIWSLFALLLVPVLFVGAQTEPPDIQEFRLFDGTITSAAIDTVERKSPWFETRGAKRIYIKTWSQAASTDTNYADSLETFTVYLSDSATTARYDTLTLVPDSVSTSVEVDSTKWVGIMNRPINDPLGAAGSGSGQWTVIYPLGPPHGAAQAPPIDPNGIIMSKYMRIGVVSNNRLTTSGFSSTSGNRTEGVNGLRMRVYVYR
jgi:hypothetical protein